MARLARYRSGFDAWAPWYDDSALQAVLFEPVHRAVVERLDSYAPDANRLLDVGCGTGRLLAAAAGTFPFVVGVDPAPQMLHMGQGRALRGTWFVCARAERLPFRSGAFDAVTSTMSLRHWRDPASGVGELARVLSPGGLVVIADADIDEGANQSRKRWRYLRPRDTVLEALLSSCGLDVVDHRLAPVQWPLPCVHVMTARMRP